MASKQRQDMARKGPLGRVAAHVAELGAQVVRGSDTQGPLRDWGSALEQRSVVAGRVDGHQYLYTQVLVHASISGLQGACRKCGMCKCGSEVV